MLERNDKKKSSAGAPVPEHMGISPCSVRIKRSANEPDYLAALVRYSGQESTLFESARWSDHAAIKKNATKDNTKDKDV